MRLWNGLLLTVDPGAGTAFLGSQGDVWDTQKDMALATLGAMISMTAIAIYGMRKKGFWKRIGKSFREQPMKEDLF